MIDAEYFRVQIRDQVTRMGRTPTVKMHLSDGLVLVLFATERVESGYVMVQAYPECRSQGIDPDAAIPSLKDGARFAVPYESIARMEVTLESQRENPLGYHV